VPADESSDLRSLLAPNRTILLVVDVQNDFCHQDGLFGRAGAETDSLQDAVDRLLPLIEAARRAAVPVVLIKTHHSRWDSSTTWQSRQIRKLSGEPCAPGSWGAEFYRVQPHPDDCVIVKHRYSAFVGTPLEVVIRSLGRSTLLLAGVTTNVCVESTARDGFMRDYGVVLIEDCTAALTKEEHEAALRNVRTYFGRVVDAGTVEACWQR
jgi:ureidoacrylate peracid hydrolase